MNKIIQEQETMNKDLVLETYHEESHIFSLYPGAPVHICIWAEKVEGGMVNSLSDPAFAKKYAEMKEKDTEGKGAHQGLKVSSTYTHTSST